ncbi:hypothetical protein HPSA20_1262 [Helicobacter pylori SouthAfrica20]|uniref:Uncharacterized protein n=1 Tax=Helicobacter pylori SouthAfrica20 TaxID=1352356 RepID=T1UAR8_HELPX|nr:hypothetical protein HPSA20_1262 [Helicobacter pylori SouthAfrica20]
MTNSLWKFIPIICTYGGVYFTTIPLKTKSYSNKNALKSLIECIKTP